MSLMLYQTIAENTLKNACFCTLSSTVPSQTISVTLLIICYYNDDIQPTVYFNILFFYLIWDSPTAFIAFIDCLWVCSSEVRPLLAAFRRKISVSFFHFLINILFLVMPQQSWNCRIKIQWYFSSSISTKFLSQMFIHTQLLILNDEVFLRLIHLYF